MSVYYDNSGLKIGEQLYTARGSQGGVMSSYMVKKTETDPNYPDSIFGKLFLFIFNDAKKNVFYSQIKPVAVLSQSPMFSFSDIA